MRQWKFVCVQVLVRIWESSWKTWFQPPEPEGEMYCSVVYDRRFTCVHFVNCCKILFFWKLGMWKKWPVKFSNRICFGRTLCTLQLVELLKCTCTFELSDDMSYVRKECRVGNLCSFNWLYFFLLLPQPIPFSLCRIWTFLTTRAPKDCTCFLWKTESVWIGKMGIN